MCWWYNFRKSAHKIPKEQHQIPRASTIGASERASERLRVGVKGATLFYVYYMPPERMNTEIYERTRISMSSTEPEYIKHTAAYTLIANMLSILFNGFLVGFLLICGVRNGMVGDA